MTTVRKTKKRNLNDCFFVDYLSKKPRVVPEGKWLVHNHIRPARTIGLNGFRIWFASPNPEDYKVCECDCGWAPNLGVHYRVVTKGGLKKAMYSAKQIAAMESKYIPETVQGILTRWNGRRTLEEICKDPWPTEQDRKREIAKEKRQK